MLILLFVTGDGTPSGESTVWSSSKGKEMAIWAISHEKQFPGKWCNNCQEIEELRRICFEFIELDNWELMSFLRRKKVNLQWTSSWLRFRTCRTRRIPWPMQENLIILKLRALLEYTTLPEACLASIFLAAWYTGLLRLPEDTCLKRLCLAVPRNVKFGCWFAHWRTPCSWIMGCGDGSVTFLKKNTHQAVRDHCRKEKDRRSSSERPSTRKNPEHESQHQAQKKREPRCGWMVTSGSRCHKRKTCSIRRSVVHLWG